MKNVSMKEVNVDGLAAFLEEILKRINERPSLDTSSHAQPHVFFAAGAVKPNSASAGSSNARARRRGRKLRCFHCQEEHVMRKCPLFSRADNDERWRIVKQLKVCQNCLGRKSHKAENCVAVMRCPVVSCTIQKRHPLLHGPSNELIKELVFCGLHVLPIATPKLTTYYRILPGHVVSSKGDWIPITVM